MQGGPGQRLASERHQVILSEAAAHWVRDFSKEQRHSISKAIAILVDEAIERRAAPGLDETPDTDFRQFLREKFSMDFEIWSHSKRG